MSWFVGELSCYCQAGMLTRLEAQGQGQGLNMQGQGQRQGLDPQ